MDIKNIISKQIWEDRYKKDIDTCEDDNLRRVAKYCSLTDKEEEEFFNVMENRLFFSAGRTMSNAGIGDLLTLNNCFNSNHVGDSIPEIFDKVKLGAITHKSGGGIGYEFSLIRPKGIKTSNDAIASGVVSFMEVFDTQTSTILQGGRRGANMSILNIYHPDIFDYLEAKSYDENKLMHFNLSIMIDDDFMRAVKDNKDIFLHYPVYDENSKIIKDESLWKIKNKVNARELWDIIMKKAYNTGEYGVFFYDNLNRDNNTHYIETIVSTNPCGEYVSGTLHGENPLNGVGIVSSDFMGACNLGSLFLHNFVEYPFTEKARINFKKLNNTIKTSVRFLDNIIDINKFPYYAYENYQKNMRTIGMGFTGLADMLVMLNVKYGDSKSISIVNYLTNFIAKCAYRASIELAQEKGSFPFLNREQFVKSGFIQKHIAVDKEWKNISDDILKYGIRNARLLSVAPTGTLSLSFGENCSSGLEPIFSLEYDRKIKIGGQSDDDIKVVKMRDYAYDLWLQKLPLGNVIVEKDKFVTAMDLPVQAHLDILKTVAFNTDMSCSKTINIPTKYSFEDTKEVYTYCWQNGIKGCTIFRPNPLRKGILMSVENKEKNEYEYGQWKELAKDTIYIKRKIYTGCGQIRLFIGWSESQKSIQDLYVKRSGKGGCERSLDTTIIGMSAVFRLGGNIKNLEKAFRGIGSCPSFTRARSKGQKLSNGNSCGIAILNEIKKFLSKQIDLSNVDDEDYNDNIDFTNEELDFLKKHGEISFAQKFNKCPECGTKITHNDGCIICNNCSWTKC